MIFTPDMIKPLREKMELTQEELARELNVGSRSINRWENKKVKKISAAVRVSLNKLYKKYMIS